MQCRATRPNSPTGRIFCWRTVLPTEDGSLWKWPRTFHNHAVMFWRLCATYINSDAEARQAKLSPAERLAFHKQHSGPVMEQLHQGLEAQFAFHQVEPNSGLGKAITYLLRHWKL